MTRAPEDFNRRAALRELLDLRERFTYWFEMGEPDELKAVFDQTRRIAYEALDELLRWEWEESVGYRGSIHMYSED